MVFHLQRNHTTNTEIEDKNAGIDFRSLIMSMSTEYFCLFLFGKYSPKYVNNFFGKLNVFK